VLPFTIFSQVPGDQQEEVAEAHSRSLMAWKKLQKMQSAAQQQKGKLYIIMACIVLLIRCRKYHDYAEPFTLVSGYKSSLSSCYSLN
jgi:hypothetical protein